MAARCSDRSPHVPAQILRAAPDGGRGAHALAAPSAHWLKGHDTGILDGPSFRYQFRKGESDGWHIADAWPVPGVTHLQVTLCSDGTLGTDEGASGERTFMSLGAGLNRARASEADPPSSLTWETKPFTVDLDVLGNIELRLDATASAADTAWIITLQDVAADDTTTTTDVTAGCLRASLRAVDENASEPGAPSLLCTSAEAVPINKMLSYRIPIVGTSYRFAAGHRLRLLLTSDNQDPNSRPR